MTYNKKREIIAVATELIGLLEDCDDLDFVDLVIECVSSGDNYLEEDEELPY